GRLLPSLRLSPAAETAVRKPLSLVRNPHSLGGGSEADSRLRIPPGSGPCCIRHGLIACEAGIRNPSIVAVNRCVIAYASPTGVLVEGVWNVVCWKCCRWITSRDTVKRCRCL